MLSAHSRRSAGARRWSCRRRGGCALRTRRPAIVFCRAVWAGDSQKLSDTLINMRVPSAWRDRVPLLLVDDRLAWFVAPTAEGVRGRVAEPFSLPEEGSRRTT